VPFNLPDTCWTVDVALRNPLGKLVVAECRRTVDAVKQDDIAAFAYKVELLRKTLDIPVAGVFMAKKSLQIGAIKVGQFNSIDLVILEEGVGPPGFSLTFLRYDAEREKKCRDIIIHVPPLSYGLTGMPAKLTHRKTSGKSESR
jgi:hypothetical protein